MSRRQAPGERSRGRKAVIAVALPLGLLAALVLQLTVVNRLPLPGGDAPDLVLLFTVAVAVRATPLTGALAGFAGGLALDVAPPQVHYAGEYALVFCLAGYGAARVAALADDGGGDQSTLVPLAVVAAAAVAGEAGKAALGLLLSDPSVTGPAIRHVLPGSALCDLLLSPVALWLVTSAAGRPAAVASVPRPEFAAATRLAAVFRLASAGAAPGLRLAGSGPVHRSPSWARHQPKLRLSDARARSWVAANGAGPSHALPLLAGGRASKLHFSSHPSHPSYGSHSSRASRASRASRRRSRAFGGGMAPQAPAAARSRTRSPSRGWLRRDQAPRIARSRTAPSRRGSPSRGWLRRDRTRSIAPARFTSPSRGWLHSSRRSPARSGWQPRASGDRSLPPSRPWSRRWHQRHQWHQRGRGDYAARRSVPYVSRPYPTRKRSYRRRLLAIVGVRR